MSMPEILEENLTPEQRLVWSINSLWNNYGDLKTKVDKDHKVLIEGNGELPLVEQVRNLNTFVNSVKYWMRFLVGALLIQTLSFLAAVIIYAVKIFPLLDQLSKNNS